MNKKKVMKALSLGGLFVISVFTVSLIQISISKVEINIGKAGQKVSVDRKQKPLKQRTEPVEKKLQPPAKRIKKKHSEADAGGSHEPSKQDIEKKMKGLVFRYVPGKGLNKADKEKIKRKVKQL